MTIEEAVAAQLLTMSAVTAITSTIRPDDMLMSDLPRGDGAAAVLIGDLQEHFENDIDGTCSLVAARLTIAAVCRNKARARALSEAIRTNGTDPGTGLAGANVTTGDLPFMAMLEERSAGMVWDQDGGDTGIHSVDSVYYLTFNETT